MLCYVMLVTLRHDGTSRDTVGDFLEPWIRVEHLGWRRLARQACVHVISNWTRRFLFYYLRTTLNLP